MYILFRTCSAYDDYGSFVLCIVCALYVCVGVFLLYLVVYLLSECLRKVIVLCD